MNYKQRSICTFCGQNPVAINCYYKGKPYYRKSCDRCSRLMASGRKLKPQPPLWFKAGYRKKDRCEMCGFKAKNPIKQLFVWHIDGNLKNNNWLNLKTICANCQIELEDTRLAWKPSPLVPDF